jgi:BirA family biotin operon repressor/biotin-[acetyl-CoA-carboxylase] ligase
MPNITYKIINLHECESTNEEAKKWIKELIEPAGLVISSKIQSAGKGMANNKWISEDGKNLLCSIVIKPNISLKKAFILNCLSCLAIQQVLIKYGIINSKIKWPNDILVNENKIAGILIENIVYDNHIKYSILGIGLNVNQIQFNNIDLNRSASSILLETNIENKVSIILNELLSHIDSFYNLISTNSIKIFQNYINQLYLMDRPSLFEVNNKELLLTIRGIGNDGSLITEDELGNRNKFYSKEIRFLK